MQIIDEKSAFSINDRGIDITYKSNIIRMEPRTNKIHLLVSSSAE